MTGYRPPVVAVLGGGQLGRMLGLAGVPLGLGFRFLDPSAAAPAQSVGDAGRRRARRRARRCSRPSRARDGRDLRVGRRPRRRGADARSARARRAPVDPRARGRRRTGWPRRRRSGSSGSRCRRVRARSTTSTTCAPRSTTIGLPAVLKTRRGGYDGKGQVVLRDRDDARRRRSPSCATAAPLILEAFVPFDRELSVLAVRSRGRRGARAGRWSRTDHVDGILRDVARARAERSTPSCRPRPRATPARCSSTSTTSACSRSSSSRSATRSLANEMAPRVHNSGHWTIEGAVTSQFENHLRAILGWPLGSTDARRRERDGEPDRRAPRPGRGARGRRARTSTATARRPRPGRKVGHITVTAADADDARHPPRRPPRPTILGTLNGALSGLSVPRTAGRAT